MDGPTSSPGFSLLNSKSGLNHSKQSGLSKNRKSVVGTNAKCRPNPEMSDVRGRPDILRTSRKRREMTHNGLGRPTRSSAKTIKLEGIETKKSALSLLHS